MTTNETHTLHITKEPPSREIVTGIQFSERARQLLSEPLKGVFAILKPDGSIVQTEMWYSLRGDDTILMNTAKFRHKYHHLQQDNPSVSLLVSAGNYQYVSMNGTVVLNDDPEIAQNDIRHLAERYEGKEAAEKMMNEEFSREKRVSIILTPTKITEYFSK